MRQKSIGEVLKLARENLGLNFVELQKMTKVQAKYLQALEHNDFEAIPDATYTRAFLERYAQVLNLDADVLLQAYDQQSLVAFYASGEEEEVLSELSRSYKVPKKKRSYLPLVYLLLSAVGIAVFVGYIVHSRMQSQTKSQGSTASYAVVSKSSTVPSSSEEEPPVSTTEPSTSINASTPQGVQLTTTGSGEQIAVSVKGATYPVAITLTGTNTTSWISLTNTNLAGGVTLTPENPTATTQLESGVTSTYITLGVVKGVSIKIADQQVDLGSLTAPSGYITVTIE